MKTKIIIILFGLLIVLSASFLSCEKEFRLRPIDNNIQFPPYLSNYNLFRGIISDLNPNDNIEIIELATPLFTDYAEKQRLLKLPAGTELIFDGDGLPRFPEGTVLAKTFFYYNDKTDLTKGKKIIETRLLTMNQGKWNVATYVWNPLQDDASLITEGGNKTVTWKQANGVDKSINYHIPSNAECSGCHRSSDELSPIGPKLRNLNIDVIRNGASVNQLQYLHNQNKLSSITANVSQLPQWDKNIFTLEERARAYLDVNCAHCHNPSGWASNTGLRFSYELPFNQTKISNKKTEIIKRMELSKDGKMPKLGTTIKHAEGVELIRRYIEQL